MRKNMARFQAGVHDENWRPDDKCEGSFVANNKLPLHQPNQNRRALGDIGNLVGALSRRCTVSKDGLQYDKRPTIAAEQAGLLERPITRKIGASLAKNPVQPCHQEVFAPKAAPQIKQGEAPLSWKSKQRGVMMHHQPAAITANRAASVVLQLPLGSKDAIWDQPRKASSNLRIATVKKRQTLTAALTAQSETICGGFEFGEEAEDILPNIDEPDVGNQLAVVDYVEDIYCFYRKSEIQSCVAPDYMSSQIDINEKMRAILIDWLTEVHLKFELMPETLFLTANLMDRYLACQKVLRKNLHLVGVTAMLVACKYEEIWAPEVQDFVFITDNAYTKEQVLEMERHMLNKLKFILTVPTPYVFLVRFLKAAGADVKLEKMAFFLAELCLTEYSMLKYCPSLLAAAAVYGAQQTLQCRPYWSTLLQCHSGYTEMHLRECASKMVSFHRNARNGGGLTVVLKKYSNAKCSSMATLEPAKCM